VKKGKGKTSSSSSSSNSSVGGASGSSFASVLAPETAADEELATVLVESASTSQLSSVASSAAQLERETIRREKLLSAVLDTSRPRPERAGFQYQPIGALLVTVNGARGLRGSSLRPFVTLDFNDQEAVSSICECLDASSSSSSSSLSSSTIKEDESGSVGKGAQARWDQTFAFEVTDPNATLRLRVMSENTLLKDSELGHIELPMSSLHGSESGGRDALEQWFPLTSESGKSEGAGMIELRIVYEYDVMWDFVACFENAERREEEAKEPEADPEPDMGYLTAFRILRGNVYRFLVAIIPILRLFLWLRGVFEWENVPQTLLVWLLFAWTMHANMLLPMLCSIVALFMIFHLFGNAKAVLRSDTRPSSLSERFTDSDAVDAMREEARPVITRIRRGRPPDTVLQDMLTLATIFHFVADGALALRKMSRVTDVSSNRNHLTWISAFQLGQERRTILALVGAAVLCALLPIVALALFALRYGSIAVITYALFVGYTKKRYPRVSINFPWTFFRKLVVRQLAPLVERGRALALAVAGRLGELKHRFDERRRAARAASDREELERRRRLEAMASPRRHHRRHHHRRHWALPSSSSDEDDNGVLDSLYRDTAGGDDDDAASKTWQVGGELSFVPRTGGHAGSVRPSTSDSSLNRAANESSSSSSPPPASTAPVAASRGRRRRETMRGPSTGALHPTGSLADTPVRHKRSRSSDAPRFQRSESVPVNGGGEQRSKRKAGTDDEFDEPRIERLTPAQLGLDVVDAAAGGEFAVVRRTRTSSDNAIAMPPASSSAAAQAGSAPSSSKSRAVAAAAAQRQRKKPKHRVLIQGLLWKRSSGLIKSWQRRLVMLIEDVPNRCVIFRNFVVAESKGEMVVRELAGEFPLTNCTLVPVNAESKVGKQFAFDLYDQVKDRHMLLAANTEDAMSKWLKELATIIKRQQYT
jgi:PH domain/C2 domain